MKKLFFMIGLALTMTCCAPAKLKTNNKDTGNAVEPPPPPVGD